MGKEGERGGGSREEGMEGERERKRKKRDDSHQVLLKSVGRHGGPTMVT